MSEYQYYDFYSMDRPLSQDEIETISTFSSRVSPSSRRATFEYSYGDFRYNEVEVLNEFFDIMLYVSSWGTKRLLMKFPASSISYEEIKEFESTDEEYYDSGLSILQHGSNIIIDFNYVDDEEAGWIEGEGMLDSMFPVRTQILNGDYRSLYLAWLHFSYIDPDEEYEKEEPPVPPNLKKPDHTLDHFIDFWRMDRDIISAAAETSQVVEEVSIDTLLSYIPKLPNEEKDAYLSKLLDNEVKAKYQLKRHLTELHKGNDHFQSPERRALKEIIADQEHQRLKRIEIEKQLAEEKRLKKMKEIGENLTDIWKQVSEFSSLKTARGYDEATKLIIDLKEYYDFKNRQDSFTAKMRGYLREFGKSEALRRRLKSHKII